MLYPSKWEAISKFSNLSILLKALMHIFKDIKFEEISKGARNRNNFEFPKKCEIFMKFTIFLYQYEMNIYACIRKLLRFD